MRIPIDDAYRVLMPLEIEDHEETPAVAKRMRIIGPNGELVESFLVVKRLDEPRKNEDAFL